LVRKDKNLLKQNLVSSLRLRNEPSKLSLSSLKLRNKIAVFIDRDGTITEEMGYLKDPKKLRLIPRSAEAIKLLNEKRIPVIVVSNQSGVARGYFTEGMVKKTNKRLKELLANKEAHLDGIYYCPHHPEFGSPKYRKDCSCRKPKPGMLLKAARRFNLDLKRCYVIGDKVEDIELAKNVGAKGILVLTGYGKKSKNKGVNPEYTTKNLYQAVKWIINNEVK
jgi:D-glycero-D-manno-heptose 1,7-bisphosphate phosphatase